MTVTHLRPLPPLPEGLEHVRNVNERIVSAIAGIPVTTLRNWRSLKKGPTYLKLGRKIVYPLASTLAWLEAHRVETTEK